MTQLSYTFSVYVFTVLLVVVSQRDQLGLTATGVAVLMGSDTIYAVSCRIGVSLSLFSARKQNGEPK